MFKELTVWEKIYCNYKEINIIYFKVLVVKTLTTKYIPVQLSIDGMCGNIRKSTEYIQPSIDARQVNIRKKMATKGSHKQLENYLRMGKKFPKTCTGNLNNNGV